LDEIGYFVEVMPLMSRIKNFYPAWIRAFVFFLILICTYCGDLFSQNKPLDSLKLILKNLPSSQLTAAGDSIKCTLLYKIIELSADEAMSVYNDEMERVARKRSLEDLTKSLHLFFEKELAEAINNKGYLANLHGQNNKALAFYQESLDLFKEAKDDNGLSSVYLNLGTAHAELGNIEQSDKFTKLSLAIQEKLGDKYGLATNYFNLGYKLLFRGDVKQALENLTKSLSLRESIKDEIGVARCLTSLGTVWKQQKDFDKAKEYYSKAYDICEKLGEKRQMATTLTNTGELYFIFRNDSAARRYYFKALAIFKELNFAMGVAQVLDNIAGSYYRPGTVDLCLKYAQEALKIREEMGDQKGIAASFRNMAIVHEGNNDISSALKCLDHALSIYEKLGFIENIGQVAEIKYRLFKKSGKYDAALKNYEIHIRLRDSVNNESTRKASIKSQLKYEYEKQAAADSVAHAKESEIKNVELKRQSAEIKAKKNQQYALFGGLGLVIIFAGFMYNRFKITQKQKGIIEHQKEIVEEQKKIVEEKQSEILDSIRYAKRIQLAQIPSEKMVEKLLKQLKK
jgi:tetratricopeptide (TPR) repeat protein